MITKHIACVPEVSVQAVGDAATGLTHVLVGNIVFLPRHIPALVAAITTASQTTFGPTMVRRDSLPAGAFYRHDGSNGRGKVYMSVAGRGPCTYDTTCYGYRGINQHGQIYHTRPDSLVYHCTGFDGTLKVDGQ